MVLNYPLYHSDNHEVIDVHGWSWICYSANLNHGQNEEESLLAGVEIHFNSGGTFHYNRADNNFKNI